MKKVVIINHGGELGNQLWNYASVLAYAREKGYDCVCPAFFQYERFFPKVKTCFWSKFFFSPLYYFFPHRRNFINRLSNFSQPFRFGRKNLLLAVKSHDEKNRMELFLLPPSENNSQRQKAELQKAEEAGSKIIFSGYAFRNPAGMTKYHQFLTEYSSPHPEVTLATDEFIAAARKKHDKLVGVHIRQDDYRTFLGGKYYFSPEQVALILHDFIAKAGLKSVCFVISSDEKIKPEIFSGLNVLFGSGEMMEDIFMLTKTDLIIGSNSSFSIFAAWYGDIPMKIFSAQPIDWSEFLAQKKFFYDPGAEVNLLHLSPKN